MAMNVNKKERICKIFDINLGASNGAITRNTENAISTYLNEHPNYKILTVTPIGHDAYNILIIFEID